MRVIYNIITKEIITTVENDNSITSFPVNTQAIQGDTETIFLLATALGLDLSQIPGLNLSPEALLFEQRKAFCTKLFRRYVLENLTISIPTQNNLANAAAFTALKTFADSGAAETIRDILVMTPNADMFPITPGYASSEERKQSFITDLNEHLNTGTGY